MKVGEKKMIKALFSEGNARVNNDWVISNNGISEWFYHGHCIATCDSEGTVNLDSCGWETVSTKSRLNAILSHLRDSRRICQDNFQWYLGEDKWYGSINIYANQE